MNNAYRNFSNSVKEAVTDAFDKTLVAELAISHALSQRLALPTTRMGDANNYFNLHHVETIRYVLNDINEEIVFDIHSTVHLIRSFWLVRYFAAFPNIVSVVDNGSTFFEAMFNADLYFSNELRAMMSKYKKEIASLSAIMMMIRNYEENKQ